MHGFSGGIGNEVKMKAGHGNLTELSEADVSKLRLMWENSVEQAPSSGFSPGCLRAPIHCAMGRLTFPTLGKSGIGQICYGGHPHLSIQPQPQLLRRRKKRHNLIHNPVGRRSSGNNPIKIPRISFNPRYPHGSKSTTIFTYTNL
jgi:hypothetical protein